MSASTDPGLRTARQAILDAHSAAEPTTSTFHLGRTFGRELLRRTRG
jgi:hypothetical protein